MLPKERNPQARKNRIFLKMFLTSPARLMLTEFRWTDGILTAVPHIQNKKANSAVI